MKTTEPSISKKPTALITGASSGIGYALAKRFAQEGYDLVIIARNEAALTALATECQTHTVSVLIIAKDLTQPAAVQEIYQSLEEKQITIDVLVNNAGMGVWGAFSETAIEEETQLVELQIMAVMRLTKVFIPSMIKRQTGKILNVGSVYSYTPVPYQSVYSASKAFLLFFSDAIRNELKEYGITVTVLCPGITTQTNFRTSLATKKEKSFLTMPAEQVAQIAYQGLLRKKAIVIPGLVNKLYVNLMRFLPRAILASGVHWIVSVFRGFKVPKKG